MIMRFVGGNANGQDVDVLIFSKYMLGFAVVRCVLMECLESIASWHVCRLTFDCDSS